MTETVKADYDQKLHVSYCFISINHKCPIEAVAYECFMQVSHYLGSQGE